jgi:nicotinate dehydrogenase subunit A
MESCTEPIPYTVIVLNGQPTTCRSAPGTKLLWVLREELGDSSARFGCGEGYCGSCMVDIDGRAQHACDLPLWAVAGRSVQTAAGLAGSRIGQALLDAFDEAQAGQCGYCIPGVLMAAHALLSANARPSRAEVGTALARNLCRCGSHVRVLAAIVDAAGRLQASEAAPA